jgi:hypothetical protein
MHGEMNANPNAMFGLERECLPPMLLWKNRDVFHKIHVELLLNL